MKKVIKLLFIAVVGYILIGFILTISFGYFPTVVSILGWPIILVVWISFPKTPLF